MLTHQEAGTRRPGKAEPKPRGRSFVGAQVTGWRQGVSSPEETVCVLKAFFLKENREVALWDRRECPEALGKFLLSLFFLIIF